jgi:hypothetical protein
MLLNKKTKSYIIIDVKWILFLNWIKLNVEHLCSKENAQTTCFKMFIIITWSSGVASPNISYHYWWLETRTSQRIDNKNLSFILYANNKAIHKVERTQHWKSVFNLFIGHNFKYGTKKLHTCPMGHETQISNKTWHEFSFMPSFLPMHCPKKLTSWPLTSMHAPSLSSLAYLTCLP